MFLVKNMVRSIRRGRYKSLLSVLICTVITLLLCLYMGNLENSRQMLRDLPKALPVTASVSNLSGSMDAGLQISEERLDGILQSEYAEHPLVSVRLMAGFGEFDIRDWAENLTMYGGGINDVDAVEGLNETDISLMEGAGTDFLQSDRMECMIQKDILEEKGLKVGDTVTLTTYYYWYWDYGEPRSSPLDVGEYTIVGTMENVGSYLGVLPANILLPFQTVRESYARAEIPFYADSCKFTINNPLELNAFKEQMGELQFLPVSATAEYSFDGNALTVRDDTFIRSAERTKESISLLEGFLPFVFLVVLFAGYLTSYLFTQNRRAEYALMRSVGVGRGKAYSVFLGEYLILSLGGSLAGGLMARGFAAAEMRDCAVSMGIFLGCYLCGTAAALAMMGRLSIMEVLTRND